jgi:hypothetical protein
LRARGLTSLNPRRGPSPQKPTPVKQTRIALSYRSGWTHDPASWNATISSTGKVWLRTHHLHFVDDCGRSVENEYRARVSRDQVAALVELILKLDVPTLQALAREVVIDDAEQMALAVIDDDSLQERNVCLSGYSLQLCSRRNPFATPRAGIELELFINTWEIVKKSLPWPDAA